MEEEQQQSQVTPASPIPPEVESLNGGAINKKRKGRSSLLLYSASEPTKVSDQKEIEEVDPIVEANTAASKDSSKKEEKKEIKTTRPSYRFFQRKNDGVYLVRFEEGLVTLENYSPLYRITMRQEDLVKVTLSEMAKNGDTILPRAMRRVIPSTPVIDWNSSIFEVRIYSCSGKILQMGESLFMFSNEEDARSFMEIIEEVMALRRVGNDEEEEEGGEE